MLLSCLPELKKKEKEMYDDYVCVLTETARCMVRRIEFMYFFLIHCSLCS